MLVFFAVLVASVAAALVVQAMDIECAHPRKRRVGRNVKVKSESKYPVAASTGAAR